MWATTSAPFGGGLLSRSGGQPNLEYLVADATSWRFPQARFDCVASIAAAHHLPLAPLLAVPANRLLRLRHTGRLGDLPELRRTWAEHGRNDRYLTLAEVRAACAGVLPGAVVRRHLLWRYSIVWRRPG